jgi:hypothetical protein
MPYPESCPECGSTFRNTGTHFTARRNEVGRHVLLELGCQNTTRRFWWDFTTGALTEDGRPSSVRRTTLAETVHAAAATNGSLHADSNGSLHAASNGSVHAATSGSLHAESNGSSHAATNGHAAVTALDPPEPTSLEASRLQDIPTPIGPEREANDIPAPIGPEREANDVPAPIGPERVSDVATDSATEGSPILELTPAPAFSPSEPSFSPSEPFSAAAEAGREPNFVALAGSPPPGAPGPLKDAFVRQLQLDRLTLRQMRSWLMSDEARRAIEVAAGATEATYERLALILFGVELPQLLGKQAAVSQSTGMSAEERLELQREKARIRARLRRAAAKAARD